MVRIKSVASFTQAEGVALVGSYHLVRPGNDVGALQNPFMRVAVRFAYPAGPNVLTEGGVGAFHPVATFLLGHTGRMVRAFPRSQVTSPSSRNASKWYQTVVDDNPTVLAISRTVVGWVSIIVWSTLSAIGTDVSN